LASDLTNAQAGSIARQLGWEAPRVEVQPVAGGDTSPTFILRGPRQKAFVKIAPSATADLLLAEADGLEALAAANSVRVPELLALGVFDEWGGHFLALEALELRSRCRACDHALGGQLALLHSKLGARYGWRRDNYLGTTLQKNSVDEKWARFFLEQRLEPQMKVYLSAHPELEQQDLLNELKHSWLGIGAEHHPEPALLHGDLWAGNAASLPDQTPVIFDPAVHFGDRECDLAMADLFGGYTDAFFSAYQNAWPLPPGWQNRRGFYQLYHLLNHANLFGGSYELSVKNQVERLLKLN